MSDVSFAVDVSNNQASHQPWKSWGVHLGFAKASEGQHSHDAWFARHIADIKADGLIPGGYHFAWPNQPAVLEAANYASAVCAAASNSLFVHALDLERYPDGARNYLGATSAQVRQYAHDWIAAVKRSFPGQKVGIYTSGDDILDGHLPGNEDFLWYPAYPVQGRSFAQAAAAARPKPSGRTVWGWQFSSVPRDQTVIYMSPAALRAWAGGTTPNAQEDDMPTAAEIAEAVYQRFTQTGAVFGPIDNPTTTDDKTVGPRPLFWEIGKDAFQANSASQKGLAQTGALLGVVTQLLAAVKDGSVLTPEQAEAAAVAGADAALDKLGQTLSNTPKEN
jgi:GH25 family lysozyme M1 (1,4-beta-N-acetylmuramidase)